MPWSNDIHCFPYANQAEMVIKAFKGGYPRDVIKFMIGGLFVRTDVTRDCVSENAYNALKDHYDLEGRDFPFETANGTITYSHLRGLIDEVRLRCEHPFPINVVYDRIKNLVDTDAINAERLGKLIEAKFKCCFITQDEDEMLTENGYGRRLPEEFDDKQLEEIPIDCRYKAVGIRLKEQL